MMKRFLQISLVMVALGVTGCAEGRYPISGEACGPTDPVLTLDARDCAVAPGG